MLLLSRGGTASGTTEVNSPKSHCYTAVEVGLEATLQPEMFYSQGQRDGKARVGPRGGHQVALLPQERQCRVAGCEDTPC